MSTGRVLDTITAIATPPGKGALAVIRLSGPLTESIVKSTFRKGKELKKIDEIEERKVYYGFIVDPEREEIIDEVTLVFYRTPRSYTGEDMAEVISHGGLIIPEKIKNLFIKMGARLAERGEFTRRAFINGKIDLIRAEAIADIIAAESEIAYRCALNNLQGKLSDRFNRIREVLMEVMADIEAVIDFDEDVLDLDMESINHNLKEIRRTIEDMINSYEKSRLLMEGLKVVIAGKPNVGKSSLLNRLLERDRAIVTDIPGTTRDTIEETLSIDGMFFKVIDTAGIRKTDDPVEKIGVERSIEKLRESDLVIFVVDSSENITEEDRFIFELLEKFNKRRIIVLNKIDKGINIDESLLPENITKIKVSAKTGEGIEELKKFIKNIIAEVENMEYYVNERHYNCLLRAKHFLDRAIKRIEENSMLDMVSVEIREVTKSLEEITGEITTEDVLNLIFSRFCIGK